MQPVPDKAGGVDAGDIDKYCVHELFEQLLGFVDVCLDESGKVPRREVRAIRPSMRKASCSAWSRPW